MNEPKCEICEKPAKIPESVLSVKYVDMSIYAEAMAVWRENHFGKKREGIDVVVLSDLNDLPSQAHWRWGHKSCIPDDGDYWFDAVRFDTAEKMLSWTAHLMEKNWLSDTDWDQTIRRFYGYAG